MCILEVKNHLAASHVTKVSTLFSFQKSSARYKRSTISVSFLIKNFGSSCKTRRRAGLCSYKIFITDIIKVYLKYFPLNVLILYFSLYEVHQMDFLCVKNYTSQIITVLFIAFPYEVIYCYTVKLLDISSNFIWKRCPIFKASL